MKINVDTPFRNLDGTPVVRPDGNTPLTVKEVLITACINPQDQDRTVPGQSYRLYKLAQGLYAGGEVTIDPSDATFLRDRVESSGYPPMTVGQITDLLNGE